MDGHGAESVELNPNNRSSPPEVYGDRNSNTVNVKSEEKLPKIWSKVAGDFMQNSTIHGLNHIVENTPYVARRFLWICIVLCGFSLFCYQVTNSVMHFFSRPVLVNVKVNYNDTLRFPAVTICNHNDFPISKAADLGWYRKLKDTFARRQDGVFDAGNTSAGGDFVDDDGLGLSLREMLLNAAHEKDDFIVKCRWAGYECSPRDFTRVLTDYGVCFTFNFGDDNHKWVNQQGSSGGLRLTINIEQYEYTKGPTDGAGLKILLHSPEEFPLVKYLGQAIAPGSHSLVGISILEVENLPEPHGKCDDSKKLHYFKHYSVSACHAECKQRVVRERCKCRDFYLNSDENDPLPSCTLHKFITCVRPLLESLGTNNLVCECPVPCRQTMYDPLITAGALSYLDKDKLLTGDLNYTTRLTEKYHRAREKRHRVDDEIVARDRKLITGMVEDINELEKVLHRVSLHVNGVRHAMDQTHQKYLPHLKVHTEVLAFQEYILKHNFVRGYNVRYERYIQHTSLDYIQFLLHLNISVHMMSASNDKTVRKILSQHILADIETKLALVAMTRGHLNDSYIGYRDGIKLSIYNYSEAYDYDTLFSPPCLFDLNKEEGPVIYDRFNLATTLMTNGLKMAKNTVLSLSKSDHSLNGTEWANIQELIMNGSRRLNYNIFIFSDRVIQKPLNIVTDSIAQFKMDMDHYEELYGRSIQYLSEIDNASVKFSYLWKHMVEIRGLAEIYFLNSSDITKAQLARYVTDKDIMASVLGVRNLFSLLRSREQDIHDEITSMKKIVERLNLFIHEKCAKPLYEKLKDDLKRYNPGNLSNADCQNVELVLMKLLRKNSCLEVRNLGKEYIQATTSIDLLERVSTDEIVHLLKSKSLSHIVGTRDDVLKNQLQIYRQYFESFIKENELDTEFIRDNFLSIDIFMRELSYQEIKQQIGYTTTNLWSDIGGSMGLFVGASVITAFEILDAFFYHSLMIRRDTKKRGNRNCKVISPKK